MSKRHSDKKFIGVRLTPEIIEKIDERADVYGGSRQDEITAILKKELFQGC